MIGADLLNLLYGNPMSQIAQATNPPIRCRTPIPMRRRDRKRL